MVLNPACQSLEARIKQANTQDEALQVTIEAAELALRAVQKAASKPEQAAMRAKASSLINKAEQLKKPNGPKLMPDIPVRKPTLKGIPGSRLKPSQKADTPAPTPAPKASNGGPSATSLTEEQNRLVLRSRIAGRGNEPRSKRKLTNAERRLVLMGSQLNGCKFPPWEAEPQMGDFVSEGEGAFKY
jgi:hypothetical protein